MAKQLVFLQIGEHRKMENFLGKIDLLIQIPLTEKTKIVTVIDELYAVAGKDQESRIAITEYEMDLEYKTKDTFLEFHGFTPEPGVKVYAIYNLKNIS